MKLLSGNNADAFAPVKIVTNILRRVQTENAFSISIESFAKDVEFQVVHSNDILKRPLASAARKQYR
jgi:hypothetical protein